MDAAADPFADRLAAWRAYTETPWARLRYAVVGEVLAGHANDLGGRLRVLDVGGGDGMDAVPLALAGHEVTIVDPSSSWLAEARRRAAEAGTTVTTIEGGLDDLPDGEWDLVLCHFVLRYRTAEVADDLRTLAGRMRPGGRLSVMDVNPDGRVLRALTTAGPAAALAELAAERAHVETFDVDVRKVPVTAVEAAASAAGLRVMGRYGNRIAGDLVTDEAAKHDPTFFADLLALELALHDREPFCRIGFAWQVVLAGGVPM